jgi:peptidoglycan hydrolase-like protein with peptidoglycan-binding domain
MTAGRHNCSDGTICVCSALPAEAPRIGNGYFWDCTPANGTCGEAAGGASATLSLVRSGQSASLELSSDTLRRADIARLQARLNTLGFDGGPADGVIGPRTRDAIRRYQAKKGFMVDGLASTGLLQSLQ